MLEFNEIGRITHLLPPRIRQIDFDEVCQQGWPFAENGDDIGQIDGFRYAVGNEQCGRTGPFADPEKQVVHFHARQFVQAPNGSSMSSSFGL
ncbi:MAG: hypothetical protein R3D43_13720 [Tepidamorphaceae bacterium]